MVDNNIGVAYTYFKRQISYLGSSEDSIRQFCDSVISRLEFVHITLDGENPYRIFKGVNSTGVDLTEADLIRNFVFMHLESSRQDDFDDRYWKPLEKHFEFTDEKQHGKLNGKEFSDFLRDFLMCNGTYVAYDTIFERFETSYKDTEPTEIAVQLAKCLDFYEVIRGKKNFKPKDTRIDEALKHLQQLTSTTTWPLLLNLMDRVDRGEMSSDDLLQAIRLLTGFILRRYICSDSSRTYGKWFVQACTEIKEEPLADLRKFLIAKGYPDNHRFKEALIRFNIYEGNYSLPILISLNNAHPHKERSDLSTITIEHIMPQNLNEQWKKHLGPDASRIHNEWKHTLGNLTLTGYNSELGDKPFFIKRKAYEDSNIILTRGIAQYTNWGSKEILERGTALADLAARIWIGPDVN